MKRLVVAVSVLAALIFTGNPAFAIGSGSRRLYTPHRVTEVMTYNCYLGADLTPAIAALQAGNPAQLAAAVSAVWAQAQASNIPKRAASIAGEIAASKPYLVGLQEVAQWSTGTTPAATNVQYDFLQLILNALGADGVHYAAVVVKNNFDQSFPLPDGTYVRLFDRDAILARTHLPAADLKLSNMQAHTFSTLVSFSSPLAGTVSVPRSWLSVDAKVRGKKFRFVNTHLEVFNPQVQVAQAQELINNLTDTSLPVVLVGDFNSDANNVGPDLTDTYADLIDAGFQDAWSELHPNLPGDTCCQQADLSNSTSDLDERIDLVLTRAGMGDSSAVVVGSETIGTSAPYWASDHASVVALLKIPTHPRFAESPEPGTFALPMTRFSLVNWKTTAPHAVPTYEWRRQ